MKILVGIGVLCVIFVVPALLLFYHQSVYSANITLTFAPKSATVKIGDTNGSFGGNNVKPGTYKIVISKKGFATFTKTVTVADGKTELVEAALQSNDPSTENWYTDHVEDYSIAQGIGDRRADREHAYMTSIFPIAQVLPIVGLYSAYRVDYGVSPTNSSKYAIFISYDTESDKRDAVSAVKSKGYDLSTYEVVYQQNSPTAFGPMNVYASSALSKRGMSSDDVTSIQTALTTTYATYQGEQITALSFGDSATHTTSADNLTDTYTTSITLNNKYERRLTIVIRDGHMTVNASAADGSDSSVIYDDASN